MPGAMARPLAAKASRRVATFSLAGRLATFFVAWGWAGGVKRAGADGALALDSSQRWRAACCVARGRFAVAFSMGDLAATMATGDVIEWEI